MFIIVKIMTALIIVTMASGLTYGYQNKLKSLPITQYFSDKDVNAVWDWAGPEAYTNKTASELADFLYLHQINTVYLDVSKTSDFGANEQFTSVQTSLNNYVSALNKHSIKVYAAAGNTDWSKPEERRKPLAVLDFVAKYNNVHPNSKLSGVEFDIEAYNQKSFPEGSSTEKAIVLGEYLDTVNELSLKVQQGNKNGEVLDLGFAVPYWFDNENGNIPSITWQNKTGPTIYHLIDTLQTNGGGNIVVMAYRNAATGNDGTIFHSRTEVDYAQSKAPNVKVIIGQELGNVEPAKITFYGRTMAELSSEVRSIADEFKTSSPAYGGIAFNDLDGLRLLDKNL
jgi:hypothetical protein